MIVFFFSMFYFETSLTYFILQSNLADNFLDEKMLCGAEEGSGAGKVVVGAGLFLQRLLQLKCLGCR